MKRKLFLLFFLITAIISSIKAQDAFKVLTQSFEKNANFSSSELNKHTLKLYLKDKNPEPITSEVLSKLSSLKLMNFNLTNSSESSTFDLIKRTYQLDNFTAFKIDVESNNYQRIYLKNKGESISDLLVINFVNDRFSLIELKGIIELDKIAVLKNSMNIQGLDALTTLNSKTENRKFRIVNVKNEAELPLVFVNGLKTTESVKVLQQINPKCISSLKVIKDGVTNKENKNDVIEIKLKEADNIFTVCEGTLYFGQNGELQCYRINDVSSPKLLIDCEAKPLAEIEKIEAKNIESIEYSNCPQLCSKVQNGNFIVMKTK